VHVANAYLSQVPLETTFQGRKIQWDVALDLLYPEVANAEQSCYLVYIDNEELPAYVGQYSGTFSERWLRNNKYVWHGKHDDVIKAALKSGKSVSIWLSVEPYAELTDGRLININKEIEQIVIESIQPKWNTTGKNNSSKNGEPVSKICDKYDRKLPELAKSIWTKFAELNIDDYLERLTRKVEDDSTTDDYTQSWGNLQMDKLANLSRQRHFLNYVSSGIPPEKALDFVWKEFP